MKCNHTCKECFKKEMGDWMEKTAKRLTEKKLCFTCGHWDELMEYKEESVRIEGGHFMIGEEDGNRMFRGFGGRKFKIRFFDGREVETTNLWHQGTIPEIWRGKGRLEDNAEWVKGE